jgi:hypothetical protein
MALLPGITQQHLPQLEVIDILPHNEKRILMLKDIKNGQNRSEILRMGITCHDMFYVIGGDDQVEHKDIIDGKFNASSNISLKQYGGCHERDSKEEFRAYMKVGYNPTCRHAFPLVKYFNFVNTSTCF